MSARPRTKPKRRAWQPRRRARGGIRGGSCEAAYFKSGQRGKTKRDEEALNGTVTNSGTTITGQLIIVGAREGQFVDGNDRPIFLFENKPGDKLTFTPIGGPAASWPEVTLELCPGSRG